MARMPKFKAPKRGNAARQSAARGSKVKDKSAEYTMPNPDLGSSKYGTNGTAPINWDDIDVSSLRPPSASGGVVNAVVDQNIKGAGILNIAGQVGKNMGSRIMKAGGGDGWGVAKMLGKSAAKGAVAGAAIGGTSEWAQGGSFWTGAKSGAFNGAVLGGGYKALRTGTGATSRNPFNRQEGPIGRAYDEWNGVSNQAKQIMQRNAGAALTNAANGLKG